MLVCERSNAIEKGYVCYSTDENQTVHGKPLTADYYRVSMDEAINPATFVPKGNKVLLIVNDVQHSHVAWEKKSSNP